MQRLRNLTRQLDAAPMPMLRIEPSGAVYVRLNLDPKAAKTLARSVVKMMRNRPADSPNHQLEGIANE